jgi:lipopolysaccharide export system protein LptA
MTSPSHIPPLLVALALLGAVPLAHEARAERGDRSQPMSIEADKPSTIDMAKQVVVFNGNVVVAQGTMRIRAERVEVRETPDGQRTALAIGSAGQPARFSQKRDGVNETIEGVGERIEFDGRSDVVRFSGNAAVRRLRGTTTADEITGNLITYNNQSEVFSVAGGGNRGAGEGRVRAVLTPRSGTPPPTPPTPPTTPTTPGAGSTGQPAAGTPR